jgi:feruloyl esterase
MLHLVSLASLGLLALAGTPAPCESLAGLSTAGEEVLGAESVPAGDWQPPEGDPLKGLPSFCRVRLRLVPSNGSDIRAELWLPAEGWNGRFLGTGNGGYGGVVQHEALGDGIRRGYATVNDDMGTSPARGFDGSALVGKPVRWLDYGFRSTHAAAVAGKRIVAVHYGRTPHHSYFVGCSNGGRQALQAAERFPADFDGIVAGCAAGAGTRAVAQVAWMHAALRATPESMPSKEQVAALHSAVLAACGPTDTGPAGEAWLADPSTCAFDPGALACAGSGTPACLAPAQVEALRKIYSGPVNPRTGARIYAGLPRGAERHGYFAWVASKPQPPWDATFRWVLGADWDVARLDLDRDFSAVLDVLAPIVDAGTSDLSRFQKRGGRLILWHGWNDPVIPAGASIDFYRDLVDRRPGPVARRLASTRSFARLFLAPGVMHCLGGPGPFGFGAVSLGASFDADHDMLSSVVRWVEQGVAPERIVASKLTVDDVPSSGVVLERPLCPWPETAVYRGAGDRSRASSFACRPRPNPSAPR